MIFVSLNDKSLTDVLGKIKKAGEGIKRDVNREVLKSAMRVTAGAKINLRNNGSIRHAAGGSGLFKSITYYHNRARYGAQVFSNVFYAEYVEEGRGPVTVKNKKVLASPIESWGYRPVNPYGSKQLPVLSKDGRYVILGRKVGPSKARPFMIPAAEKERPIYIENLKRVLNKNT